MQNNERFDAKSLVLLRRVKRQAVPHPGTFVRLNSGGPIGLVIDVDCDDRTNIHWLGSHNQIIACECVCPAVRFSSSVYDVRQTGEVDRKI